MVHLGPAGWPPVHRCVRRHDDHCGILSEEDAAGDCSRRESLAGTGDALGLRFLGTAAAGVQAYVDGSTNEPVWGLLRRSGKISVSALGTVPCRVAAC